MLYSKYLVLKICVFSVVPPPFLGEGVIFLSKSIPFFIIKEGKKDILRNAVMPGLALVASLFMVLVAILAHGVFPYQEAAVGKFSFPVLFYLIVFAVIMGFGALFYRKNAVSSLSERTDDEE